MLRSCLSQCKLNYLLRTLPPGLALEACKRFDMGLRHSLESITRSSLDDAAWQQAALSIRLGGLGLREAVASAPTAFMGSRNTTRELTSHLVGGGLSTSLDISGDEEEGILRAKLSVELPGINLNAASQRVLQSALDAKALSKCKESASIRDRARLNTLGTPLAGAWLRAIPNPNLSLAMSRHEFVPAVRMWLGIRLFPSPPQSLRCTCGQIMDEFGDHLLGCAHGPLRIKRHDALRNIIWHALLMDDKGAAREQHCGNSNNRPGDVYHPDFALGKSAYFDVSVRSSLQPKFLSRAAVQAGAAGEAGEIEKDSKHEEDVVSAGDLFFLLVVESLGLWTPSSLHTLRTIASRASSVNGIPLGLAVRNLLQQLSTRLWAYNA